jgi:hypothetical protein
MIVAAAVTSSLDRLDLVQAVNLDQQPAAALHVQRRLLPRRAAALVARGSDAQALLLAGGRSLFLPPCASG